MGSVGGSFTHREGQHIQVSTFQSSLYALKEFLGPVKEHPASRFLAVFSIPRSAFSVTTTQIQRRSAILVGPVEHHHNDMRVITRYYDSMALQARGVKVARPTRNWVRKTYTVSEIVDTVVRAKAAQDDLDPGTVIDLLVWNALIKPNEEQLKQGGFEPQELERIFAEEALAEIQGEECIDLLMEQLLLSGSIEEGDPPQSPSTIRRKVKALVRRWQRTRHIDKEHQVAVIQWLGDQSIVPSILRLKLVDQEWFERET